MISSGRPSPRRDGLRSFRPSCFPFTVTPWTSALLILRCFFLLKGLDVARFTRPPTLLSRLGLLFEAGDLYFGDYMVLRVDFMFLLVTFFLTFAIEDGLL